MSKGYDSDNRNGRDLQEDIDFDFFGSPGRAEEKSDFHTRHTAAKKDQTSSFSDKERKMSNDSNTENGSTKLETRVPCVEMEKETMQAQRRSRSRSPSSDTDSIDSEREKERQMEHERKSKRPPSGKKKTPQNSRTSGHSDGQSREDGRYSDDEYSGRHSRHSSYSDHELDKTPKESKSRRKAKDKSSAKGDEYEDDFSGSESSYTTSSYTSSDTESDVTDVSPLPSPLHTPKTSSQNGKEEPSGITDEDIKRKLQQKLTKADSDTLDLKLLMQAMLELDREQKQKAKKTVFVVPPPNYKKEKKNYTFSDDQAMDIDRENQRLMQKILKEAREAQLAKEQRRKQKKQISAKSRLTSSAVNRQRRLEQIERENQNILKRLEGAKATRSLQRNHLLHQYNNHTLFGVSVAAAHPVSTVRKRAKSAGSPYDTASLGSRTRSLTSVRSDNASLASHSTAVSARSTQRSRPQSGQSQSKLPPGGYSPPRRPLSGHTPARGKQTFVRSRPEWEPGW